MLPGIIPHHSLRNVPYGNDRFTKLLLHGDGANNSTSFIDDSPAQRGSASVTGTSKVSTANSKFGGASILFNGAPGADYITFPDHADFNFAAGVDFAIDFWVKITDPSNQQAIFGKCNGSGTDGYYFYTNANGMAQWVWFDTTDGALRSSNTPTGVLGNDTNWHHVLIHVVAGFTAVYVDGVVQAINTISSIPTTTWPFTIGRVGNWSALSSKIYVDEFRVSKGTKRWEFNTPFTPPAAPYSPSFAPLFDPNTKFLVHADAAPVMDVSNAAHGAATLSGATVSTAQAKFGAASLNFTGASTATWSSHADFNFGANDFTIEWFEYRGAGGGSVALSRDFVSVYNAFVLSLDASGIRQVYMSSTGSSWDVASAKSLGAMNYNAWVHLAITRNGNTFRTFKDGVLQDTWTSSAALLTSSSPLCVGAYNGANGYVGYIDEIRISNVARWTASFTPPAAPYNP